MQDGDVLFQGTFLQQSRELLRFCPHRLVSLRISDDNAGRVEIVIQGVAFPEELRGKEHVWILFFFPEFSCIAHRYGGLDDDAGFGTRFFDQIDYCLDRRGVKEIPPAVIIGRCGNDDNFRISVRRLCVHGGREIQILLSQILLYVFILDGRLPMVHHIHLFRNNIHRHHMVVLRKKSG